MKNTVFPHKFWRPFLDCMPQLFFRPQYVWFPVHLKGHLIPLCYETLVVNWQNWLFTLFHQSRSILSPNPINNKPILVQIMAWYRTEVVSYRYICVTRLRWLNLLKPNDANILVGARLSLVQVMSLFEPWSEPMLSNCGRFPSQRASNTELYFLPFPLAWTSYWTNALFAGDLRHHCAHTILAAGAAPVRTIKYHYHTQPPHQKLSKWQLPLQSETKTSSMWQHFRFSSHRRISFQLKIPYFNAVMVILRAAATVPCNDVIMGTMASQITSLAIVYTTVYSSADNIWTLLYCQHSKQPNITSKLVKIMQYFKLDMNTHHVFERRVANLQSTIWFDDLYH